jgi:small conductance mechanosensitive channel
MVPNGDVRVVANETRDWARALVELNFSFEADISKAVAALDEALTKMAADPRVKPHLLAAPEIFGWNTFNEWAVVVRMRARVTAGKQGEVARVMRQYALEALTQAGVPIANPHRVMVQPVEAVSGTVGGGAQAS